MSQPDPVMKFTTNLHFTAISLILLGGAAVFAPTSFAATKSAKSRTVPKAAKAPGVSKAGKAGKAERTSAPSGAPSGAPTSCVPQVCSGTLSCNCPNALGRVGDAFCKGFVSTLADCISGCCIKSSRLRRTQDLGDRRLTLQYMTDRFKEEGSVRAFVDSLGLS